MPPIPPNPPSEAERRVLARRPAECFRHGVLQSLPFLLVIFPFGILFGVVATDAGLDLAQVIGFSLLVLAGASQFTAVQLLADHAPVVIIFISALVVNLRMAMYSASIAPWIGEASPRQRGLVAYLLIDQTYALSYQEYEKHPALRVDQRLAYFFGTALVCCFPWIIATIVGATVGQAIPESWALDFAIPITFIAMIAPMLRTPAHRAATFVAIVASLIFAGLPSGLGLLVAAPLGMAAGAWVEIRSERAQEGRA